MESTKTIWSRDGLGCVLAACFFCFVTGLFAQATFTPGTPAVSAVPAKLVATAGTGATGTSCTLTGNTVPATAITWNCTVAAQANFISGTIPFPTGSVPFAVTIQLNTGTAANTVLVTLTPGSTGIAVQATVNGGTAVTGTF